MKLNEFQSTDVNGPAWVNVNTKEIIPVDVHSSHSSSVFLHPEQFGFTFKDLLNDPRTEEYADAIEQMDHITDDNDEITDMVDGEPGPIQFMNDRGWVRVIYHDSRSTGNPNETSIAADNLRQAVKALRILGNDHKTVVMDVAGSHYSLSGRRLEMFLKNGAIPRDTIHEAYKAYVPDATERNDLLRMFKPKYPKVYAHHVTYSMKNKDKMPPPDIQTAQIVGWADSGDGIEAAVVAIDGSTERPDGGTYHITWSLDPEKYKPFNSNQIIANGWEKLPNPVTISLSPTQI